jgi:two-component sensor histidine kinase
MHELATNAAKHGALSTPDGRVDVAWRPLGTGDRLILRWVETGGPEIDQAPARRGFGSRVVEGVVRGQLGGTLDLSWPGSGLVCEISIPLARPSKSAGTVAAGRSAA